MPQPPPQPKLRCPVCGGVVPRAGGPCPHCEAKAKGDKAIGGFFDHGAKQTQR